MAGELLGLFGLAGGGDVKAGAKGSGRIGSIGADLYAKTPGLYNELSQLYMNPLDPATEAGFNTMRANTMRDFGQASGGLQRSLVNRGLGKSSYMGGALASLYNQQGRNMAQINQQEMTDARQRRLAALQAMLGVAQGGGSTGLAGYGQQAQLGQQRIQNAMGGLNSLFGMVGNGMVPGGFLDKLFAGNNNPVGATGPVNIGN